MITWGDVWADLAWDGELSSDSSLHLESDSLELMSSPRIVLDSTTVGWHDHPDDHVVLETGSFDGLDSSHHNDIVGLDIWVAYVIVIGTTIEVTLLVVVRSTTIEVARLVIVFRHGCIIWSVLGCALIQKHAW